MHGTCDERAGHVGGGRFERAQGHCGGGGGGGAQQTHRPPLLFAVGGPYHTHLSFACRLVSHHRVGAKASEHTAQVHTLVNLESRGHTFGFSFSFVVVFV